MLARVVALAVLAASSVTSARATHHYTQAQRYAGCLFGEAVPLMRRGMPREDAIAAASDRCVPWSTNLSAADIGDADLDVHRAIERLQRQGL